MIIANHAQPGRSRHRRAWLRLGVLVVIAILGFVLALTAGSMDIGLRGVWNVLLGDASELTQRVVFELRLPRAGHAFITGALLAMAGALMQVLLRNPLADPYVLGISGGSAVFALLALIFGLSGLSVSVFAFLGALLAMLLVFGLARGAGSWTPTRLLLTGIVLASGWGAIISFILSVAPQGQLRSLIFWLMGDLSFAENITPGVITLIVGVLASLYAARNLNLLALGAEQAATFGLDIKRFRWQVYVLASLLTATAVVQVGNIGFVGLIVPHLLRLAGLRDYRYLIPASVLAGGSLLLFADTLARSAIPDVSLPVGVLTAAIGVPIFIFLLYRGNKAL
jgi:iron complex transport system permease protein